MTYLHTHPWLTFSLDLSKASYDLWLLLGECRSKCDHLKGSPLSPAAAERLYRVYLAKGVQGTTAIEGNTLTVDQVEAHLEGRLHLPPSLNYLGQEVDNIVAACNEIAESIFVKHDLFLTVERIKHYNRMVLKGLDLPEGVVPGEIPDFMVGVGRYRGCPRQECDELLGKLAAWLNGGDFILREPLGVAMSLIKAVVAHVYLAWIHPFGDGNGRTARLLEVHILNASGVPAPAAHLLSNFYNKTRAEYYRQLEAASARGGNLLPFITYAVRGFRDGLAEQIQEVRYQQWETMWVNHVHQSLPGDQADEKRRRRLLLDLSSRSEGATLQELRELTPRLAAAYATLTERTLLRDVEKLKATGLVRQTGRAYEANRSLILAWLPPAIDPLESGTVQSPKPTPSTAPQT